MSDVVTLYAGTRRVALHRDFTKLTMKLRPVNAFPYFLFTPLVDGNNLISPNADSEKKFATAMARDVPISPLIPPEEW